jgi:hypothetical protein
MKGGMEVKPYSAGCSELLPDPLKDQALLALLEVAMGVMSQPAMELRQ